MFLRMFGVLQSCFAIALTWSSGEDQTLGPQRIHQEFLEHIMQFYQKKMRTWPMGPAAIHWHVKKDVFTTLSKQVCVGGGKNVVDDNTNHQGARMVFSHHEFDWYPGRAQNVDDDHDTFVMRFHEDVIDRRWHQVKGMMKRKVIGTMGMTQTRNQACFSRTNDMTRKIDCNISSPSKFVLREEGPGSTVKI